MGKPGSRACGKGTSFTVLTITATFIAFLCALYALAYILGGTTWVVRVTVYALSLFTLSAVCCRVLGLDASILGLLPVGERGLAKGVVAGFTIKFIMLVVTVALYATYVVTKAYFPGLSRVFHGGCEFWIKGLEPQEFSAAELLAASLLGALSIAVEELFFRGVVIGAIVRSHGPSATRRAKYASVAMFALSRAHPLWGT